MLRISKDYATMYNNIIIETDRYCRENGLKSLVIGLSGGIDSALTAALASVVCKINEFPLIGRSMPIVSNKPDEVHRATLTGKAFCDDFEEVTGLDALYDTLYTAIATPARVVNDPSKAERIRRGNIKARMRMIKLYDEAHFNNGIVLSTDNYTELMLGFWTICGDVGDFGMLQNLWKTEVYGLAQWVCDNYTSLADPDVVARVEALELCIKATPTDGLGVSSSDFEQLGVDSYEEVDTILLDYLLRKEGDISNPIIERHERTHFKRNVPINLTREVILNGIV